MRARVEKVDVLGWNKSNVVNSVSTIAAESSDVASEVSMHDLSNYQDSVEVDYSKTNKNESSSVQDPIKNVMMIMIPK